MTAPAHDITDAVAAENQFNEPPPDGSRFIAVDVALTYSGEGSDNGFTVTSRAVSTGNVSLGSNCGVIPNALDVATDVFSGGAISGAICFVVPVDQVAGLVPYLVAGFNAEPSTFAAQ